MGGLVLWMAFVLPAMADDDTCPEDLFRFVCAPAAVKEYYRFAEAHRTWVKTNVPYDFGWVADAEWCRDCWSYLDDAMMYYEHDNKPWVITSLRALRRMIGEEAFQMGRMPPFTPYWRFREVP